MLSNLNRPKFKNLTNPKPLIIKGYNNLSRTMYYALIGIITETISDMEKEKIKKIKKNGKFRRMLQKNIFINNSVSR